MAKRFDAVIYGTICVDVLWRVAELPPPGGYADVIEEKMAIGGEAANTAIALARWGVRPALIGNEIGEDVDGRLLLEMFASDAPDIDTQFLRVNRSTITPNCVCMASADGERTMFGRRFIDMPCMPLDDTLVRQAGLFTVEPNAYAAGVEACRVASGAGAYIVTMDYADDEEMSKMSSIVMTSSERIGRNFPREELNLYASKIRDSCGPTTIVTWGERGCFLADQSCAGEAATHVPAYRAPSVMDSTGAGDVFRAGLIYGKLQDWSLLRTVQFASAAAALNCGEQGGWCGVRSVREIEEFQRSAAGG